MELVLAGLLSLQSAAPAARVGVVEMTAENRRLISQWAAEAAKTGDGNANVLALDKKLKVEFGYDPWAADYSLVSNDAMFVGLVTPLHLFRVGFLEAMRMMEPPPQVPIESGVVIAVSPKQVDAPKIVKIVVQRDGSIVQPLRSALAEKEVQNRMGATFTVTSGEVVFPASAFLPGARVTVTLIPQTGGNQTIELPAALLSALR